VLFYDKIAKLLLCTQVFQ